MLSGRGLTDSARWRWLGGELMVVIVGVLIALSIEQAWSDRQDRKLELEYLKTIQSSVQADIEYVEGFSTESLKRKFAALKSIGPIIRGTESVPDDVLEFFTKVSLGAIGGISPTYVVRRSTFDELLSTGNLSLIEDVNIRSEIVSYYRRYDIRHQRTVERTTGYPAFIHGTFPSELRDDLDLESLQSFNVDRAISKVLSDEFQSLLNREYNLALFLRASDGDFLRRTRQFLAELTAHIEQLEQN